MRNIYLLLFLLCCGCIASNDIVSSPKKLQLVLQGQWLIDKESAIKSNWAREIFKVGSSIQVSNDTTIRMDSIDYNYYFKNSLIYFRRNFVLGPFKIINSSLGHIVFIYDKNKTGYDTIALARRF